MCDEIRIVLGSANMGNLATEADYDDWTRYVLENIENHCKISVASVDQSPFSWCEEDVISGADDEQRREIASFLGVDGWGAWCAAGTAPVQPDPQPVRWAA